jgi:hypothetical protein
LYDRTVLLQNSEELTVYRHYAIACQQSHVPDNDQKLATVDAWTMEFIDVNSWLIRGGEESLKIIKTEANKSYNRGPRFSAGNAWGTNNRHPDFNCEYSIGMSG